MGMNEEKDDVEFSDEGLDDSVVAEEHMGDTVKKLRERLKDAEAKAKEYLDSWQRAQADFVNLRKRDEEDKTNFLKFANVGLIEELVPVLDALNSAVSHGEKGAEQIQSLMLKTLKQQSLEEIDPKGETFDPSKHEAVGMQECDREEDDHKVLEVLQKGYSINGRIIRPARNG